MKMQKNANPKQVQFHVYASVNQSGQFVLRPRHVSCEDVSDVVICWDVLSSAVLQNLQPLRQPQTHLPSSPDCHRG